MTTKTSDVGDLAAIDQAFGQVLQEIRQERGLSQEKLSFNSGLHRTYISLIERGKRSPTLSTLSKLAAALSVLPSEILRRFESRIGWSAVNSIVAGRDDENHPS
jgi:transcriptional regulator with XRE-family HTH domain